MQKHWSLLFVVLGVVLAASGGYFLWDAYVCSTTEMVFVEPTDSAEDPVPFDSLSDRQQEVFGRSLRNSHVTVDDDLDLPDTVRYEGEAYAVLTAHGDGCWMIAIPATLVALFGFALVGFGRHRLRGRT